MSKEDGGPAFPVTPIYAEDANMTCSGMSLRDWFAGQALSGLLANGPLQKDAAERGTIATGQFTNTLTIASYKIAGEMLAARGGDHE